jgi:hypothetical protein
MTHVFSFPFSASKQLPVQFACVLTWNWDHSDAERWPVHIVVNLTGR